MKGNDFLEKYIHHQWGKWKVTNEIKAIIYWTGKETKAWTYQELYNAAKILKNNILAESSSKIEEGAVIAVAVNDYPDYIIALLAIWGLNCIYMPLDSHRKENLEAWIKTRLQLAGAKILITNQGKFSSSLFSEIKHIIHLEWEKISTQKSHADMPASCLIAPKEKSLELAYAYIYSSSGTSGMPKMIENTFEGLWGRVKGTADRLKITQNSGLLAYCAPDFDASLLDILMALSRGACLYPVHQAARTQLEQLKYIFETVQDEQIPITSAVLTPVVLNSLKNMYPSLKPFQTLRTLITMGEECGIENLKHWFNANRKLKIFNGYGPTETTIAASVTELDRNAFIQSSDEKLKEKIENLLPMHDILPGVKLYFLVEEEKQSSILTLEKLEHSQEVEIIIGGLGIGRYRQPNLVGENKQAKKFIAQLNDEHFIRLNEKEKWVYKRYGDDENLKTIEITGENLPFEKGHRYYLTGDKVCITPTKKNSHGYDLRFISRIDKAGKRNGIMTLFKQVEELISENCKDIIEQVKVVAIKNNFAAFITPKKLTDENEFNEKFFENLYENKTGRKESRLLPSFYFLIDAVPGSINNIKSAQTFPALLRESKRMMVPRGRKQIDTQSLNETEEEVIKIWQSILFGGMDEILEFQKFNKTADIKSLFNKESHFLHFGGDSVNLMDMISLVWRRICQDSDTPQNFVNAVVMQPTLGKIADLINIYKLIKISTYGTSKDYPLIYLQKIKPDYNKLLREKTFCEIVVEHKDIKLTTEELAKIVEEKLRIHYPAGPYLLVSRHKNPLTKQLFFNLRKSERDFVKIINLKSADQSKTISLINKITNDIIAQSCIYKIKKWNHDNDSNQSALFYDGEFFNIPEQDTWYQSAAYSGKTSYLAAWRKKLWSEEKIWPIYLDVSGRWEKNIVDILFEKIGFSTKEMQYLQNKKILLMIDHYDRMLRNDILDFRAHCAFKNWKNLTIWVVSRYLQIEKLTQNQNILLPNINIITDDKKNYILNEALKEEKLTDFLTKYISKEQALQPRLQKLEINIVEFIEFVRYFLESSISVENICIEKSPWENNVIESDLTQFRRGHPYFIILRGFLSHEAGKYYFQDELKLAFTQFHAVSILKKLPEVESKTYLESKRLNKALTIEELKQQNYFHCYLPPNNQRIPIIAFYPLTGEIPHHYFRLFEMIGDFQPWLAFAMNVAQFSNIQAADSMDYMANYYADILARLYFQSYILLGWSFGALLAFRVAEKLKLLEVRVNMVINIDCPPPDYLQHWPELERAKLIISSLAEQKGYRLDENDQVRIKKFVKDCKIDNTHKFFEAIRKELTLNHHASFLKMLQRAEINLRAYYNFKAEKIEIPLKVAIASKRTIGLNENADYIKWKQFTSDFDSQIFEYDHFDICHAKELATWIRDRLQAVQLSVDSGSFSERLQKYYESVIEDPPFFLELDGADDKDVHQRKPLLSLCEKFIHSSICRLLLIYGLPGSGKSTLLMKLAGQIVKQKTYDEKIFRLIYIKINTHTDCIKEELMRAGFSLEEYEKWKQIPSLIIMDGIENITDKANIWEKNRLDSWASVKLILSCRHETLAYSSGIYSNHGNDQKTNVEKVYCLPLSSMQKQQFLVMHSTDSINLSEKFKKLRIHHFIDDIASNTLIFSMLINLIKNHNLAIIRENSRYDFYKYFFEQKIALARNLLDLQRGVYYGTDFDKMSWNYVFKVVGDQKNYKIRFSKFPSTQQAEMATLSLLTSSNGKIHDSFRDFFRAKKLWNFLNQENLIENRNNPWHQESLYNKSSLLNFIVDQFNALSSAKRKEKSNDYIQYLQKKQVGPCFSANLISFLVMARQAFNHIKFSDLSFRAANLANAVFYRCDFNGTNFTEAFIYNSIFIDCIFKNVNTTKIKLEVDSEIPIKHSKSICISPNNKYLCCFTNPVDEKNSIIMYDLEKNKPIIEIPIKNDSVSSPIRFGKNGNLTIATRPNFSKLHKIIRNFCNYLNDKSATDIDKFISHLPKNAKLNRALKDIIDDCKSIEIKENNEDSGDDDFFDSELCRLAVENSINEYFNNIIIKITDLFTYPASTIDHFLGFLKSKKSDFGDAEELANVIEEILIYHQEFIFPKELIKKLNTHKNSLIDFPEVKLKIRDSSYGDINFARKPGKPDRFPMGFDRVLTLKDYSITNSAISACKKYIAFTQSKDPFSIIVCETKAMKEMYQLHLYQGNKRQVVNDNSFYKYALKMEKIHGLPEDEIDIDFERHISDLSFNSDASLLAAISKDNLITVFNLHTRKIKDIIYPHVKLYHKKFSYDKTICFASNARVVAISNNGVSSWKIGEYHHNLNYLLPKFYTALTLDRSAGRLYGLSNLYIGDSWGHISRLDINDGRVVKTIYQFEDEIVNKMAISEAKSYLAVITYTPSQQYKLSILINKYTEIAYEKTLCVLPDDFYFSESNTLILSVKCYDFEYKIYKQLNKLKLSLLSSEPKPKSVKHLPNMIPEKILNILGIIKDWEYSAPYLILIGIHYNLMCWKLDKGKSCLLWALGSIGNNFKHSAIYNNVPAKKRNEPVVSKSWEIRAILDNTIFENKNSFIEKKQSYEKLKLSGIFPQNILNPGVK